MLEQLIIKVGKEESIEINLLDFTTCSLSDIQEKSFRKLRMIMVDACTKIHDEGLIKEILPKREKNQEFVFECIVSKHKEI
jgi:hypothetical protein